MIDDARGAHHMVSSAGSIIDFYGVTSHSLSRCLNCLGYADLLEPRKTNHSSLTTACHCWCLRAEVEGPASHPDLSQEVYGTPGGIVGMISAISIVAEDLNRG